MLGRDILRDTVGRDLAASVHCSGIDTRDHQGQGSNLRISDHSVQPSRSNPYTRFGVFVHLVKVLSQPLA